MRRIATGLALGALLMLSAPTPGVADQTGSALEEFLVESADTPGEHAALARYYRAKAADAQSVADHHKAMASDYKKPGMKQHCDKLVKLSQDMAAEFEALAKEHDALAK